MKTAFGYFQYFLLFFLSISIFWNYILKNCNLRFIFPNSLSSCILGVPATKILIRSVLCFALLNFLCNHFVANHFVLVSEPNINSNFYKYNAITRIASSYNFIKFYEYHIGNYDTFRRKIHVALHTKIDLNLHLMKRASRTINLLNVFRNGNLLDKYCCDRSTYNIRFFKN